MKNTKIQNLFKRQRLFTSTTALALAVMIGGAAFFQSSSTTLPNFPEVMDPIMEAVMIQEEEVPLAAAPKVSTKTTSKTTKKNVKLSKASAKTYIKNLPTTKKTTSKKSVSSTKTVTTQTTVATAVSEKYTKKSNIKAVTTKVTTTVKTTTATAAATTTQAKPTETKTYTKYTTTVNQVAPKMDSRILKAYNTLNFKLIVDPNVNYSGYFDARNQSITLNAKQFDLYSDTVYHELGHFVAFLAGNVDTRPDFTSIYNAEKNAFTGVTKTYAIQSSSEFFAECVRIYVLDPATLQKTCPKTYATIQNALNSVTDERVQLMKDVYAAYWKY